jgi:hypothetical protein
MDRWFESKLSQLGKLDYYKKPEKYRGLKLDANENLALKKDFIKKIAIKAAEKEDLRQENIHYNKLMTFIYSFQNILK